MPTNVMLEHMGYDEFGNCRRLLCVDDLNAVEKGTWVRADGNSICDGCGMRYGAHPPVQGALWLKRLCDRRLVKL